MHNLAATVAALAILAAAVLPAGPVLAADAEGQITSIDRENLTITLEDGEAYKLPGEFDVSALQEGMEVLVAYDEVGGERLITDMQLPE